MWRSGLSFVSSNWGPYQLGLGKIRNGSVILGHVCSNPGLRVAHSFILPKIYFSIFYLNYFFIRHRTCIVEHLCFNWSLILKQLGNIVMLGISKQCVTLPGFENNVQGIFIKCQSKIYSFILQNFPRCFLRKPAWTFTF